MCGKMNPARATRKLRQFASRYRIDVCLLKGLEQTGKMPVSVLVFGSGTTRDYLSKLIFGENHPAPVTDRQWTWNMRSILKRTPADMVIISDIEKHCFRQVMPENSLFIPDWVHGKIVFSRTFARMKSSGHVKSDLRRIRKNGLEYEVTRSSSKFDDFYHTMYVPYISKTYGSLALLMSYERMKEVEGKSELMLIRKGDEYISGQILVYENDGVRCWSIGVRDGNHDYVKMGAQAALYFYEVQYLSEKGYKAMSVGSSRAFLNDGVLQFKNKWGMHVTGSSKKGLLMKPLRKTPGLMSFLESNPFIRTDSGTPVAVVFPSHDNCGKGDFYRHLHTHYCLPGLEALQIYGAESIGKEDRGPGPGECPITNHPLDCLF